MTWLGLLVDAVVTFFYRTEREEERLAREREEARVRAIEESDARFKDELAKAKKQREAERP